MLCQMPAQGKLELYTQVKGQIAWTWVGLQSYSHHFTERIARNRKPAPPKLEAQTRGLQVGYGLAKVSTAFLYTDIWMDQNLKPSVRIQPTGSYIVALDATCSDFICFNHIISQENLKIYNFLKNLNCGTLNSHSPIAAGSVQSTPLLNVRLPHFTHRRRSLFATGQQSLYTVSRGKKA